jgi:hypothetical protein
MHASPATPFVRAGLLLLLGCSALLGNTGPARPAATTRPVSADRAEAAATPAVSDPNAEIDRTLQLLAAGDSLAALRALDRLATAHPGQPRLAALRDQLHASLRDSLALHVLRAEARPSITRAQLPPAANVLHAHHLRRFRALAESKFPPDAAALLEEVTAFQKQHPDFTDGWLLLARLAVLLERPEPGHAAGARLAALRAWESPAPETIRLLEALDQRGWFPRADITPPSLPREALAELARSRAADTPTRSSSSDDAVARIRAALGAGRGTSP